MKGRFLANARASWSMQDKWKLTLEVQNLLNQVLLPVGQRHHDLAG